MTYELTFDDPGRDTNTFYRRTLHVLSDARVPFLVGGSHAFLHYTGIVRETKDFDLFVRRDNLEAALEVVTADEQVEVLRFANDAGVVQKRVRAADKKWHARVAEHVQGATIEGIGVATRIIESELVCHAGLRWNRDWRPRCQGAIPRLAGRQRHLVARI